MKIYDLAKLPDEVLDSVGGKARGLALLASYGFETPWGTVIKGLETDVDFETAADFYELQGSPCVAVRSSAGAEDGSDFSSAGQYASVLNVEGRENFIAALRECVGSLKSETAQSYSSFFADARSTEMNVVVQDMVDAAAAGVCFTIDPATGDEKVIIEAVEGLGESLVSGMAAAEHFEIPCIRNGRDLLPDMSAEIKSGILPRETVVAIAEQALEAAACFGHPLDMEWAVDRQGRLVWLQARPVTTDREIGIDELDSKGMSGDTVFTTCNIGEMLPGAVTPLSLSTSVMGIDMGLRRMLVTAGAYKNIGQVPVCIPHFSNKLFFNLTAIYKMGYTILMAGKPHVENSICGKTLDTPEPGFRHSNVMVKAYNAGRYFKFLFSRKKAMKKLDLMAETFRIEESADIETYFNRIDAEAGKFVDSAWYHYVTSSYSGAMSSTLLMMIKADGTDDGQARSLMAGLLEEIDDIESVDILRSMRRLAAAVAKRLPDSANMTPEELREFVLASKGEIKEAYEYFIRRHGHRGIREAEMRSRSWEDDCESLFGNVLTIINSGSVAAREQPSQLEKYKSQLLDGKKGTAQSGLKWVLEQARAGVYSREYTKARYIKVLDVFKRAYKRLANMLVEAGALPDADLVYFLTQDELRELVVGKKSGLIKTALKRRRLLPEQQAVKYKDVYIGEPVPVKEKTVVAENGAVLNGVPISRGEVTGRARVVKSVDDAKKLKNGEIMVAVFTDIGWSPYYSVIGGLVTEVGSALSHGAVVAREYGLPLVVNVSNATGTIRTGDMLRLDATNGRIVITETAASVKLKAGKAA